MTTLLTATQLDVAIGGRVFCRGLELSLQAGEVLAVLGPNGAGKTTLLQTLAGLRAPQSGEIRLAGRPYSDWEGSAAARCRAILAQNQSDHFSSSVLETTLVGRHPHLGRWGWEGRADLEIARAALAKMGMQGTEARDILSLSGGERQRVALAALLAQQPRLFLLDEPLNHLDLHYQMTTLALFRQLADEGSGVVLVLHDINLAARHSDRVLLLDGRGGAVVGPVAEILSDERLTATFGYPLRAFNVDGQSIFLPQ